MEVSNIAMGQSPDFDSYNNKKIDKKSVKTDEEIRGFCKQLGIKSPF